MHGLWRKTDRICSSRFSFICFRLHVLFMIHYLWLIYLMICIIHPKSVFYTCPDFTTWYVLHWPEVKPQCVIPYFREHRRYKHYRSKRKIRNRPSNLDSQKKPKKLRSLCEVFFLERVAQRVLFRSRGPNLAGNTVCRALFCIVVFAMASNVLIFTGPCRSLSNVLLGDLPEDSFRKV